jgi:hypothetical protein
MPLICSRMTRFTTSMRVCISRNWGTIALTTSRMPASSTGTDTTMSQDSPTSWRKAMITPPTIMIGAMTIIVVVTMTSICTCWTSLVLRVISDGAPNRPTSRLENRPAVPKTAARTSRPNAMEAFAPK